MNKRKECRNKSCGLRGIVVVTDATECAACHGPLVLSAYREVLEDFFGGEGPGTA